MILADSPVIEIAAGTVDDSEAQEVYRNLQVLYGTHTGEQALDRDFGIDISTTDYPQESAQALLAAEYVRKTKMYEPRARVVRVEWTDSKDMAPTAVRFERWPGPFLLCGEVDKSAADRYF